MFCPKCGSVLVEKKKRFGCVKCGYSTKEKIKLQVTEKMKEKHEIGVLHERESSVWPVTAATCSKCKNNEAFFWSAQMRAADEAETRFFRCTKCKYTWREYA